MIFEEAFQEPDKMGWNAHYDVNESSYVECCGANTTKKLWRQIVS